MGKILKIGSLPFLIILCDNLLVISLNYVLRRYGGEVMGDRYISCAAVVQSFMVLVTYPAQGITSGCGTLYSYHYGAGNTLCISSLRRLYGDTVRGGTAVSGDVRKNFCTGSVCGGIIGVLYPQVYCRTSGSSGTVRDCGRADSHGNDSGGAAHILFS